MFSKSDILRQLADMQVPQDIPVMVHSSLKAVGAVEGGAEGLLDALITHITARGGLLCIPTHTWHNLGKEITLDMASDDQCLGVLSAVALRDDRGIRSENPTHSVVVFGDRERAGRLIENEPFVTSATAPAGCHGKLCSDGGFVLLVGVNHSRNTYLHAVAELLELPNRMADTPVRTCVLRQSGERVCRDLTLYHTDYTGDISQRFPKYETAFRYHRCITDGFVGNAPTQLCDARKMKAVVEHIYRHSGGRDPLADEAPIPQAWYCSP